MQQRKIGGKRGRRLRLDQACFSHKKHNYICYKTTLYHTFMEIHMETMFYILHIQNLELVGCLIKKVIL
jgi:hypothetical protein